MHLYWVTTEDHDEDWFVVAPDPYEATYFYETFEGYDEGDADSEWIMELPDELVEEVGWASHELLRSCGAQFLREETPRVIELADRKFCEGMLEYTLRKLEDDKFEAIGNGRPNRTDPGQDN